MMKLTVKEDKKNKNIHKEKNETPRPELKSIVKKKIKPRTAKPIGVNNRKITEFLLLCKDREKTSNFKNPQKPVARPAKQENQDQIKTQTLSDVRRGRGGKLLGEKSYNNDGKITQPTKGDVRRTTIGQM